MSTTDRIEGHNDVRGRDEVVKAVDLRGAGTQLGQRQPRAGLVTNLAFARASEVPLLAELASSADVRNGQDCAILLHPGQNRRAEEGVNRDGEAAVAWFECKG